jgi:D-tyrosyl-tRNA(Tyr) deacylase
MRALLQRVTEARVSVDGKVVGQIDHGLLVLLAVQPGDTEAIADKMVHKITNYRVFSDAEGKMNRSVCDVNGGVLWVSQFTLAADTQKGLRPSFTSAAAPDVARALFDYTVAKASQLPIVNQTGCFGAYMQVSLVNDGPVTFMLEMPAD